MNVNIRTASQAQPAESARAYPFVARPYARGLVASFAISALIHVAAVFAISGQRIGVLRSPSGLLLVRLAGGTSGGQPGSGEARTTDGAGAVRAGAAAVTGPRNERRQKVGEHAAALTVSRPAKNGKQRHGTDPAIAAQHARDVERIVSAASKPVTAPASHSAAEDEPQGQRASPVVGESVGDDARIASAGPAAGNDGAGPGGLGRGVGSAGSGGGAGFGFGSARSSYEQQLAAWLEHYKQYPDLARRRGLEGTASLRVAIRRDGSLISAALQAPSRHDVLDRAALALVHRAEPFPRMPSDLAGDRFEFVVPIRFHLDQRG